MLKNWAITSRTLSASSSGLNKGMSLFEVPVRVSGVTASTLTLFRLDSEDSVTLELDDVTFSIETVDTSLILQLTFPDGKHTVIREID